MDVVSGVAAVVALGAVMLEVSQSLRKLVKGIKYAKREMEKLIKEMGAFANLCQDFYWTCISGQKKRVGITSSTDPLVAWIVDALRSFEKLLDRVRALAGEEGYSMLETISARFKWYFKEKEVKCLRSSLSVARESMNGFMNITVIEILEEEMADLRAAIRRGGRRAIREIENKLGMTVEEKMEELTQMSQQRRKQRHVIKSCIQEAVEKLEQQNIKISHTEILPDIEQLLEFTTVVEQYADKVVISLKHYGRRRRHHSRSTGSSKTQPNRADSTRPTIPTTSTSLMTRPSSASTPFEARPSSLSTETLENIMNYCTRCSGTCVNITVHQKSLPLPSAPHRKTKSTATTHEQGYRRYDQEHELGDESMVLREYLLPQPDTFPLHPLHASKSMPEPLSINKRRESLATSSIQGLNDTKEDVYEICEAPRHLQHAAASMESIISEGPSIRMYATSLHDGEHNDYDDHSGEEVQVDEEELWDEMVAKEEAKQDTGPSPFHPVAGVQGSAPPGWHTRHERSDSPNDHWHKKL